MQQALDKPSRRRLKLTEAEEIELRAWFFSARTVAQKARELRISRDTLYRYVNRKHQRRKQVVDIDSLADGISDTSVRFRVEQSEHS